MKELKEYIKSGRKYVVIEEGQSFIGTYEGYTIGPDRFNPGRETVSYLFKPLGSSSMLPWTKSSYRIAQQMSKFNVGDTIKITRHGQGTETKYVLVKIDKDEMHLKEEEVPF